MGKLVVIGVLAFCACLALVRPWVGVVASYVFVILNPQTIWFWHFEGLRPAFVLLAATLLGVCIGLVRKQFDFRIMLNRRNLYMLLLWVFFTLSYHFGSYVGIQGELRFTDPDWAMETINKILLSYFIACLCLDDRRKIFALVIGILVSTIYFTYWANSMYLTGSYAGRLAGPTRFGEGIYADENTFALMFVTFLPFLWFAGQLVQKAVYRYALWLVIPFGWHAVFLTGSRGGLLGIAATIFILIVRSKKKLFSILLVPAFAIAFVWQAGPVMQERALTISEYETEGSAAGRIEAWGAAISMAMRHPIIGVGLASFGPAFPDHSPAIPREAHNTFFQIFGESGAIAGLMYLLIVAAGLLGLWRNGRKLDAARPSKGRQQLYYFNEATLVGFFGLIVCSLFLSMHMFEIFYIMCALINAILYVSWRELKTPPLGEPAKLRSNRAAIRQ